MSKPADSAAPPGLVVVATPIGNARDMSRRGLEALAGADVVACEDSRVTSKLLSVHAISAKLLSYHEHNAAKARPNLIKRLKRGETVALVSDAGTPLVSDPGYRLVRACIDEGIPVTAVPGPSAALTALVLSGLPTDRFFVQGFLPPKRSARRNALAGLVDVPGSLVLFESARRLPASLADMAETLGDREAAVAREMTKLFEEVRRGTLQDLADHYAESGPPRGEVVVVVGPPGPAEALDPAVVDGRLRTALEHGSVREAAAEVAAATGLPKRTLYRRALELKGK